MDMERKIATVVRIPYACPCRMRLSEIKSMRPSNQAYAIYRQITLTRYSCTIFAPSCNRTTGSAGGRIRKNGVVKGIAEMMGGVSPQILLYSFTMELGGSPLIGTQNISHMQEDVDSLIRHRMKWEKADLVAMAAQIDKNLAAQIDKNLV